MNSSDESQLIHTNKSQMPLECRRKFLSANRTCTLNVLFLKKKTKGRRSIRSVAHHKLDKIPLSVLVGDFTHCEKKERKENRGCYMYLWASANPCENAFYFVCVMNQNLWTIVDLEVTAFASLVHDGPYILDWEKTDKTVEGLYCCPCVCLSENKIQDERMNRFGHGFC